MTALLLWISMTSVIGLFWVAMALIAEVLERRVK